MGIVDFLLYFLSGAISCAGVVCLLLAHTEEWPRTERDKLLTPVLFKRAVTMCAAIICWLIAVIFFLLAR